MYIVHALIQANIHVSIQVYIYTFIGLIDVYVIDLVCPRRREMGDRLGPFSRHGGIDWYHCGGLASSSHLWVAVCVCV